MAAMLSRIGLLDLLLQVFHLERLDFGTVLALDERLELLGLNVPAALMEADQRVELGGPAHRDLFEDALETGVEHEVAKLVADRFESMGDVIFCR